MVAQDAWMRLPRAAAMIDDMWVVLWGVWTWEKIYWYINMCVCLCELPVLERFLQSVTDIRLFEGVTSVPLEGGKYATQIHPISICFL